MRSRFIVLSVLKGVLRMVGFFVASLPLVGLAQEEIPALRFKNLTLETGLPDNRNGFISKDSRGFIWISSMDGLSRFDGVSIRPYRYESGDSLSQEDNIVTGKVFEDKDHNLWFSVYSGILKLNRATEKFEFHQLVSNPAVEDYYAFYLDPGQNLWVSAKDVNKVFHIYKFNLTAGEDAVLLDSVTLRRCAVQTDESRRVRRLVGTPLQWPGLEVIDIPPGGGTPRRRSYFNRKGDPTIRGQLIVHDSLVWLAASSGLIRFNPATGAAAQPITGAQGQAFGGAWSVAAIPESELAMVSTGKAGIWVFNTRTGMVLDGYRYQSGIPFSLPRDSINELYIDPQKNLWASIYSYGVSYANLKKVKFKTYFAGRKPDGQFYTASSVAADAAGNIWAIVDGQLYQISPGKTPRQWIADPSKPGEKPQYLYADRAGDIWLLQGKSVWRLDNRTNRFARFAYTEEAARLIFQTAEGRYLLRAGKNLFTFDESAQLDTVALDGNVEFPSITYCYQDRAGRLIMSMNAANLVIARFTAPNRLQTIHNKKGIGYCYGIYEPANTDFYWLATWKGVVKLKKDNFDFTLLNEDNSRIPGGIYYRILPVSGNKLMISGNKSLIEYNLEDRSVRNFTQEDGAVLWGYSNYGAAVLPDGQFVFGGKGGINLFHPDSIRLITDTPQLQITRLRVNEKDFADTYDFLKNNRLEFDHTQKTFEFYFTALEFSDVASIRYQHRLLGLETDWVDGGINGYARYAKLKPGPYTFEVQACNSDGIWIPDDKVLRLSVYIRPAFYQITWVRILTLLILVAIGVYIYLLYAKRKLEARQQQELQAFKTQFFANITHDFRTPLTLIKSPVLDAWQTGKVLEKEEVGVVMQNVARLEKYVNQVLDLNKLEAGQLKPQYGLGDLAQVLEDYVSGFIPSARHRKTALTFRSSVESLPMDLAPEFLDHIAGNLLNNAIKFTPPGGQITVTLDRITEPGGTASARIQVLDTGPGLPPENLEKIFDRFFQNKEDRHRGAGTGIGLHFTRQLTELLGGSIRASNRTEGGACFTVTLPVKITDSLPEINSALVNAPDPAKTAETATEGNPVILIVEDDVQMAHYIRRRLNRKYRCHLASDGLEGEEMARNLMPDLIVSDVMMPRQDGLELLQKLKNAEDTSSIPVVMLTAKSSVTTRLDALKSWADAYLPKPFNPEELLAQVDNLIQQRRRLKDYYKNLITGAPSADPPANRSAKDEAFLSEISGFIQSRLMETLTVEDLAQGMLLSTSGLYNKCKSLLDFSPQELIEEVRIKEARHLLDTTDVPVGDVAMQTGYSDPSYFIKVFKKKNGCTPAQYRRGRR